MGIYINTVRHPSRQQWGLLGWESTNDLCGYPYDFYYFRAARLYSEEGEYYPDIPIWNFWNAAKDGAIIIVCASIVAVGCEIMVRRFSARRKR